MSAMPSAEERDWPLRFLRRLLLWGTVVPICAVPSWLWASLGFDKGGMAAGIAVFILAYALITSTDAFEEFRRDRPIEWTLRIGFGTRIALCTVLFPVGMGIDLLPGMLSVGMVGGSEPRAGSGVSFGPTLLITLIQGTLLNIILISYMLVVWVIARLVVKPLRRVEGICDKCGYDLRASPERCPECGDPVPPARPTLKYR